MTKALSRAQSSIESITDTSTIMLWMKFRQSRGSSWWAISFLQMWIGPIKQSNTLWYTIQWTILMNSTKDTPKGTWLQVSISTLPLRPPLPSTPLMTSGPMEPAQEWSLDSQLVHSPLFRSVSEAHRSFYCSQYDSLNFLRICQPNSLNYGLQRLQCLQLHGGTQRYRTRSIT